MTTRMIPLVALLATLGLAACQEEGGEGGGSEAETGEVESGETEGSETESQ